MKVLFVGKKGLGDFFVEFKPIAEDWLTWKGGITGEMKLIHEKCYYKLAMKKDIDLKYILGTGCTFCGEEAPENVKNFISLANGLKDYIV